MYSIVRFINVDSINFLLCVFYLCVGNPRALCLLLLATNAGKANLMNFSPSIMLLIEHFTAKTDFNSSNMLAY